MLDKPEAIFLNDRTDEKSLRVEGPLQSPKLCLRRTSLKLGVSDRSFRRMFKELDGFTYRTKIAQRLTETDERAHLQYCSRVLSMTYADPDFFSNIWFSDESHIHLNGYINRETTRFLELSYRNNCIVCGLRFGAPYPDTEYWALISSKMMRRTR